MNDYLKKEVDNFYKEMKRTKWQDKTDVQKFLEKERVREYKQKKKRLQYEVEYRE